VKSLVAASLCSLCFAACGGTDPPAQDPSSIVGVSPEPTAVPLASASPSATDSTSAPQIPEGATDTMAANPTSADEPAVPGSGGAPTSDESARAPAGDVRTRAPADRHPGDADDTRLDDREGATLTPTDQGGTDAERKITAAVRREIVRDKSLSFTAKNIKIMTVGGKVTLRGPVKNFQEKTAVEAHARQADGVTQVDNQLDVKN
jgi:hyperosmotically inducible periplasmic protein